MLGLRTDWKPQSPLERALKRRHAVGATVQLMRGGALTECASVGYARLNPVMPATNETIYRTASIAKLAAALLVMRLQTKGLLNVDEDISDFWGAPIRNPHCPDVPIPLASLMSHTSGLVDCAAYYDAFQTGAAVSDLLQSGACFAPRKPGERFVYSNFAAGLIGCLLEKRFGESLEALAQRELFGPLGVTATFALSTLAGKPVADSYRVLPPSRSPAFDAAGRITSAKSVLTPDPERHFLLAAGGLFLTAPDLAKLALLGLREPFLSADSLRRMKAPIAKWPDQRLRMTHGLGLLCLNDPSVYPRPLYGHQGFAYGAVNGVLLDEAGNGFVCLSSGASEQRLGHLSLLNADLSRLVGGAR